MESLSKFVLCLALFCGAISAEVKTLCPPEVVVQADAPTFRGYWSALSMAQMVLRNVLPVDQGLTERIKFAIRALGPDTSIQRAVQTGMDEAQCGEKYRTIDHRRSLTSAQPSELPVYVIVHPDEPLQTPILRHLQSRAHGAVAWLVNVLYFVREPELLSEVTGLLFSEDGEHRLRVHTGPVHLVGQFVELCMALAVNDLLMKMPANGSIPEFHLHSDLVLSYYHRRTVKEVLDGLEAPKRREKQIDFAERMLNGAGDDTYKAVNSEGGRVEFEGTSGSRHRRVVIIFE